MAEEPDNLVLRMLREMREILDGHTAILDRHTAEFASLNRKFDEWQESTATGLGLAAHANIRTQHIEEELADLKRRVERLEQPTHG